MRATYTPVFWRDARMPYVELRKVADGRKVCYALHSHSQWSLGAITQGQSSFVYNDTCHLVKEGDLVLMNPEWPHACNPIENQSWAYFMLYVDSAWLTQLRYQAGLADTLDDSNQLDNLRWQDIERAVITEPHFYTGFCVLANSLLDPNKALLDKQIQVVEYLSDLMQSLSKEPQQHYLEKPSIMLTLADYLNRHCTQELSLDSLCTLSGYSPSHLIRTFKQHFGMTPHAYIINRRIQYSQQQLKQGSSISATALDAGFADQAHFQRTFKRLVAATPDQYRHSLSPTVN